MTNNRSKLWMGIAGCALVFGFFMPWIDLGGMGGVSGYDLVRSDALSTWTRFILALCPLGGALLAATAFGGSKLAGRVSLAMGGGVLGYTTFKIAYGFIKITGWGLWLVLIAGAIAIIAGLGARVRGGAAQS